MQFIRDGFQGNSTSVDKCRCDPPNILVWNNGIPCCNAPEPENTDIEGEI
jgi:hypothetical protein